MDPPITSTLTLNWINLSYISRLWKANSLKESAKKKEKMKRKERKKEKLLKNRKC